MLKEWPKGNENSAHKAVLFSSFSFLQFSLFSFHCDCCLRQRLVKALYRPWHSRLPWLLSLFLIMPFPSCWLILFSEYEMKKHFRSLSQFLSSVPTPSYVGSGLGVICCQIPLAARSMSPPQILIATAGLFFGAHLMSAKQYLCDLLDNHTENTMALLYCPLLDGLLEVKWQ